MCYVLYILCVYIYIYTHICWLTTPTAPFFLLVPAIRGLAYSEERVYVKFGAIGGNKNPASSRGSRRWHDTETHGAWAHYRAHSRAGREGG